MRCIVQQYRFWIQRENAFLEYASGRQLGWKKIMFLPIIYGYRLSSP